MATRELLSPTQREAFATVPPLSERDLARHYTLSPEELEVVARHRRPHNRLGFAVQLAYLRFPGRPLAPGEDVPPALLVTIAAQAGVDPAALAEYARERDETRREHLLELQRAFGYRPFDAGAYRELAAWLLPTALSTDSGVALVTALVEELRARKIVRPALSTVERLGWETRRRAQRLVFARLTAGLTEAQRAALDALLVTPPGAPVSPLRALRQPPGRPAPEAFRKVVERLEAVRALGLDPELARRVHQNRLLRLAREGARYTPQFLQRFAPARRYATLVATLLDASAALTDQALELHDRLIGQFHGQSQQAHAERFQHHGRAINEKVRLSAAVGRALIAAREGAGDAFAAIQAVLPWEAFVSSVDEAEGLARPAFDSLELLDESYAQLRRYALVLLEAFAFEAAPASRPLLEALDVLRLLYRTGRRKVPRDAPAAFVRPRWAPHVFTDKGVDRAYYELCALSELRDRLRAGDVWVAGSRQHRALDDYLLPEAAWRELRQTGPVPVAVETDAAAYLARRRREVHDELETVAHLMETDRRSDARLRDGRLVISPLPTAVPPEAEALQEEVAALLPRVKITELPIEVDELTGFGRHCTHLHTGRPPRDATALHAALLAEATNLGLEKMAAACPGRTFPQLAWVAD